VTTVLHRLDVDERYIVMNGRGRISIEGCDTVEIGAGDVALVPAGKAQCVENLGEHDLVFYCLCTPRFEPRHYHACA
jgi:mannose-6-phosphate isomerase-like protein (cupin superfamily)